MPMTRRGARRVLQRGEAGDHAGVRGAGDRAHDDRVEEDAELLLLLGDLVRPVGEAEPAERVLGRAGRDRVRRAAGVLDVARARPATMSRMPMSKPDGSSRTSAPMMRDSRMLPTLSLTGSGQSTHFSCTRRHLQAELGRDGRDLAGVVGLEAADGDQRVGALGERVRDEVLELAGLVAAEGEP